ncbi:Uncharacterised protein [Streptococcus pneumoniae]|nr:Uncharacterised protein [Streptococcus pneumoniae]
MRGAARSGQVVVRRRPPRRLQPSGGMDPTKAREAMSQPTRTLPQLLQPVARAVTYTAVTVAGFVVLSLPSLWTGPM